MALLTDRFRGQILPLLLSLSSFLANLEWVNIPFSSYGLRGPSAIFFGTFTLYITFSFHPAGWVWWTAIGLQAFATMIVLMNSAELHSIIRFFIFALPAILLFSLDVFIADRFGTISLWPMYALGIIPSALLLISGACYARA